ncbi:MAG: class I SAM-dependent methyltransferase [Candidatus Saccharibacteria bacterium]
MNSEQRELWNRLWEERQHEDWDPVSQQIYETIINECGNLYGKNVLETGSGSGRISLRLAESGANVIMVDFSEEAIRQSQASFQKRFQAGRFFVADMMKLSLEDNSVDLAWNAGVLEHYSEEEQIQALAELSRVTCNGGKIISINPYGSCLPYRLGKFYAEQAGTWPYGIENPVYSLQPVCRQAGLKLIKEYSIAPWEALNFLDFIPGSETLKALISAFCNSIGADELKALPGYLLVSVIDVEKKAPTKSSAKLKSWFRMLGSSGVQNG